MISKKTIESWHRFSLRWNYQFVVLYTSIQLMNIQVPEVCQDIWHAQQRIISTLSSKHPCYKIACKVCNSFGFMYNLHMLQEIKEILVSVTQATSYPTVQAFINKIREWELRWEKTPAEYSTSKEGFLLKVCIYRLKQDM